MEWNSNKIIDVITSRLLLKLKLLKY